jgi:hypothetical protein
MTSKLIPVALLALLLVGAVVSAQNDDDLPSGSANIDATAEAAVGGDDEPLDNDDSDDDTPKTAAGLTMKSIFTNYPDLKVPAGEQLQMIIATQNAPANGEYKAVFARAHITALGDHSRIIQNFSSAVYDRTVKAGNTASVKYTVTPHANLDPMDYSFVVEMWLHDAENTTTRSAAYNGTLTVTEPLGVDPKNIFTIVFFGGGIAYAIYYFLSQKTAVAATKSKKAPLETGTKGNAFDAEYVSAEHRAYTTKAKGGRSASK